jgi:hypothetical protein
MSRVYVVDKHNIPVPCSFVYTTLLPVLNGTFYFHKYLTNVIQSINKPKFSSDIAVTVFIIVCLLEQLTFYPISSSHSVLHFLFSFQFCYCYKSNILYKLLIFIYKNEVLAVFYVIQ